jgi:hypothetical protein
MNAPPTFLYSPLRDTSRSTVASIRAVDDADADASSSLLAAVLVPAFAPKPVPVPAVVAAAAAVARGLSVAEVAEPAPLLLVDALRLCLKPVDGRSDGAN